MIRLTKHVGVDGCPEGRLAVEYEGETFRSAEQYNDVEALWDVHDAELILIDVPIGLRKEDNTPRPSDAAARSCLEFPRSSSVFPTPVRRVLDAESYGEARRIQKDETDGSLRARGISNRIRQFDELMYLINRKWTEPSASTIPKSVTEH